MGVRVVVPVALTVAMTMAMTVTVTVTVSMATMIMCMFYIRSQLTNPVGLEGWDNTMQEKSTDNV